jgi:hypothetical protein
MVLYNEHNEILKIREGWKKTAVVCVKCKLPGILKMFLGDCQPPKTTELRDTKYSDVCYVVM